MDHDDEFLDIGHPLFGPEALSAPLVRRAWAACVEDARFSVIGLRRIDGARAADAIIVDCRNDRVPSKNARGIRYVERLALVFWMDPEQAPEVRALRKSFPATEHQNSVKQGDPAWLCVYFEPWVAVARSWTGRRFLERIIVWLGDVAAGELHRADQPVEQFYFTSPWELVLPETVREKGVPEDQILEVRVATPASRQKGLMTSRLLSRSAPASGAVVSSVVVEIAPVVSGAIQQPPLTLGELASQLERRGSGLLQPLVKSLDRLAEVKGVGAQENELGLLILRVPVKRRAEGPVEVSQITAFVVEKGLGAVGAALGIFRHDAGKKRFYRAVALGSVEPVYGDSWRTLDIDQLATLEALDRSLARRLTDVSPTSADFPGTLIGAGSLGSALGEIWAREAWGTWTILEPDLLKPHNVPRHRGVREEIGLPKAIAVARRMDAGAPEDSVPTKAIPEDALSQKTEVQGAIAQAALIVDASTTLHVPRILSRTETAARCSSVFFTPSGQSAVILVEDSERKVRLDALEAQYYRAILRTDWGAGHLAGHRAREFWIGAGCREITTLLSPELVSQHAGLLARRLRKLRDEPGAAIGVWDHDDANGAVTAHPVPIASSIVVTLHEWTIRWDEEIRTRVRRLRADALPRETGGVLIGFVDQIDRVIQLVDALPAPADSVEAPGAFERGLTGVAADLANIGDRTAGIVGYIGEWHSHPDGVASSPSRADYSQLIFLAHHLRDEGLPALILIVGEMIEGFAVGEAAD